MLTNKDLAISLAACESENEVVQLLKSEGYWNNSSCWRPFGDNENNWSTIGNQQSEADSALVEKLVNSIDAILMKECLIRGISPESDQAPHSIAEALEQYFNIKKGRIEDLSQSERTKLAKNIVLAATGSKPSKGGGMEKYPNITIVDAGEGQSPKQMPNTILSINKSNKLKVPFVQGKFNMGGTGVLRFCGEHNIQLIISKRCPDIPSNNDETHSYWGLTVIRRIRPGDGRRSSLFQYLVNSENNGILFFEADKLSIIPTSKKKNNDMEYGMFCKLFEYKMSSRLCSNINMGLYLRLSTLLPNLAYPIYLDECREYSAHTMFRTLSGLNVRLSDQASSASNNIDEKLSAKFIIDGQELSAAIYVFKKVNDKGVEVDTTQFRSDEGILLTQNGQTHGHFDKKFYRRNSVNLSYLADSLLTIVDCSNINEATREDLFMNSRDRMSAGGFAAKLESTLEDYFKNNEILKALQAKRREEAISNKLDDEKPLEDVLNSVFKSSTVLSRLFITGERLQNPTSLGTASEDETFEGKYNPTYFQIINKKKEAVCRRPVQIGRKFRIKFKTDANNDFFSREDYPGQYMLSCQDYNCKNHNMNLHNGYATLTLELPEEAKVGDEFIYNCVVKDTNTEKEFLNQFIVEVCEYKDTTSTGGHRLPPSGKDKEGNSISPSGISLPNVVEVSANEWDQHNFEKTSALKIEVADADNNIYDFFVNMDNIHLLSELKPIAKHAAKIRLLKARYKYSMVLVGLSILGYYANENNQLSDGETLESVVESFSKMVSPIILPMIEVMGSSDLTEIIEG